VIEKGKKLSSQHNILRAVYLSEPKPKDKPPVAMAAVVPKRNGGAVWRNRVKRLIREAFRLNKSAFVTRCTETNTRVTVIFFTGTLTQKNAPKLYLQDIQPAMDDLLRKLITSV
jgi:ribonuclease P protein component